MIREKVRCIQKEKEIMTDDFLRQLLQGKDETWEKDIALSQLEMLTPFLGLPFNDMKQSSIRLILERFLFRAQLDQ